MSNQILSHHPVDWYWCYVYTWKQPVTSYRVGLGVLVAELVYICKLYKASTAIMGSFRSNKKQVETTQALNTGYDHPIIHYTSSQSCLQ